MILKSGYSNRGGRERNEDSCAALQRGALFCAVLADGLGKHGGGDVASRVAVDTVKQNFKEQSRKTDISREKLENWFYQANEKILAQQTRECQMKTTLAVLCLDSSTREAKWAHLGDSRIYHFVDGRQEFCTFDHSVSRMAVLMGEITLDEIRFHPDRSKLLKVVGKDEMARPEYGECQLEKGKKHAFLVCSDGFWEYVTEKDMESALKASATPEEWIERMREKLENRVDGRNDNNSAIAIFI